MLLVTSPCPLNNDVDLESRNILDTDEVMRIAIGLSCQVRAKVVAKLNPFHLIVLLIKRNRFLSMGYKISCELLCLF